jgi:molybdopterin-guanine dinucleotide biosynthesis protein B
MRIIGLAGWSGSGKTTLMTKLVPCLTARGLRVSTLKHAHHSFDLDQPGKDSFLHRAAGATEVLISSGKRWALMHELRGEPEWNLPHLIAKLSPVDLIIVEGFKRDRTIPKVEVHRIENGKPLLYPEDPSIVAIACDSTIPEPPIPRIDLNDIEAIADAALAYANPLAAAHMVQGLA